MSISAAEIGQIIKRKIADFDAPVVSAESGVITTLGDGIAQIYGLEGAMAGELLAFPHDIMGLALNLEEDQVRAIILGRFEELREGDEVRTTGRHDPCVGIRGVPVVEAMAACVLADAFLRHRGQTGGGAFMPGSRQRL